MSPPDSTKDSVRPSGLAPLVDRSADQPDGGESRPALWADFDRGWSMTVELMTATFVWGGIGWLGDRWLGTSPWLMAAGFILGHALGMYMVWVRSRGAWHATAAATADTAATARKVRADATEDAGGQTPSGSDP